MSKQLKVRCTPEEYLARERQTSGKSEFYGGEIFAMTGASRWHNLIVSNILRELSSQLKGRPCVAYPSDMRVKVSTTGLYTYPDVVVVCGDEQFEDIEQDTLLNPTLIVEVLSPSTVRYDRVEKSAHYRKLDSLQEYLLVAQDRPHVEHYARQSSQQWLLSETDDLRDTIQLVSINCRLALGEAYDKVEFSPRESVQ